MKQTPFFFTFFFTFP
ncbi:pheA operon leader peptide PheL [Enterobacter hormaechei]